MEYDPALDPVAAIVLTIECAPGQVDSIVGFLADVKTKAGVYAAVVQVVGVKEPKRVEVEPVSEPSVGEPQVAVSEEPKPEGEANGEQAVEHADHEPEAAAVGQGSETAPTGIAEHVGDGESSVVAESAWEVGSGSVERGP